MSFGHWTAWGRAAKTLKTIFFQVLIDNTCRDVFIRKWSLACQAIANATLMETCWNTMQKKWEGGSNSQKSLCLPHSASMYCKWSSAEAPAVSIARSMRSVGKANPGLVGRNKGMRDDHATRDVTSLLTRAGYALKVPLDELAAKLNALTRFSFHWQRHRRNGMF